MTLYYMQNSGWLGVDWDGSSWDPPGFVLDPGQGYVLYKTAGGVTNWTETKPYTWP